MKTANECFAEAQKALEQAFDLAEVNPEASLRCTEIAHAWLQAARDLGEPAA